MFVQEVLVYNVGPDTAQDFVIVAEVPSSAEFHSVVAHESLTCTRPAVGASGAVRCSMLTLPYPGGRRIWVSSRVRNDAAIGSVLTYRSWTSAANDISPSDNSLLAHRLVQSGTERADLAATVAHAPSSIGVGQEVVHTFAVSNLSADTSGYVNVFFVTPTSSDTRIEAPPGWSCVFIPHLIITPPPIDIHGCGTFQVATGTLLFRAAFRTYRAGQVQSSVSVETATVDPDRSNNATSATTLVRSENGVVASAVPALSPALLALLALMLAALGARASDRRQ